MVSALLAAGALNVTPTGVTANRADARISVDSWFKEFVAVSGRRYTKP